MSVQSASPPQSSPRSRLPRPSLMQRDCLRRMIVRGDLIRRRDGWAAGTELNAYPGGTITGLSMRGLVETFWTMDGPRGGRGEERARLTDAGRALALDLIGGRA